MAGVPGRPPSENLSSSSLSPDAGPWSTETSDHPLSSQSRRNYPGGAIPRDQSGDQVRCGLPPSHSSGGGIQMQPESEGDGFEIVPSGKSEDEKSSDDCPKKKDDTTRHMEGLIDQYRHLMPYYLKVGYYDVMILYSEDDREKAEKYKWHLMNEIKLEKGHNVKAVLYDDQELVSLAGSKLKSLEYGFKRCTFAFVYLTKSFCECEWCAFSSEECLMEAIYNKDKKWCVVPVYTVQRSKGNFKIPMGLNSLKGVNYYTNDDFYKRGLSRLIGDKLHVRLDAEHRHFNNQFTWACQERDRQQILEYKRKQLQIQAIEKNTAMHEYMLQHSKSQQENLEHSVDSKQQLGLSRTKSDDFQKLPPYDPIKSKSDISGLGEEVYSLQKEKEMLYSRTSGREASEHGESAEAPNFSLESEESYEGPHYSLDSQPSLDQGYPSHEHVVSQLQRQNLDQGAFRQGMEEYNYHSRSDNARGQSHKQKVVEIHEHHHYYETPQNKVINYNIEGASNVIVGSGTIVSNTAGGYDRVIDDEDSTSRKLSPSPPSHLALGVARPPATDTQVSVDYSPSTRPSNNTFQFQRSNESSESNKSPEPNEAALQSRGPVVNTEKKSPVPSTDEKSPFERTVVKSLDSSTTTKSLVASTNKMLPAKSTDEKSSVSNASQQCLPSDNHSKGGKSDVSQDGKPSRLASKGESKEHSEKRHHVPPVVGVARPIPRPRVDPVPTQYHPLGQETEVKTVGDGDSEETSLKEVRTRYTQRQHEGEEITVHETECKVVTSHSNISASGKETSVSLGSGTGVKQDENVDTASEALDQCLETDSPGFPDTRGEKRVVETRSSDPGLQEFVKLDYEGTDVDYGHMPSMLQGDEFKIAAIPKVLEMGYEDVQIRDAVRNLQKLKPGHKHFSINELLDMMNGVYDVPTAMESISQAGTSTEQGISSSSSSSAESSRNLQRNPQEQKPSREKKGVLTAIRNFFR